MSKTTKTAAAKKTSRKAAPATVVTKPRRRRGPVLSIDPIELPRVPGHEYGQHRHVSAMQPGDTIYVGGRQNLSTLEIAEVRAEKNGRTVTIVALAVEFQHEGVLYTGSEQVTFLVDVNSRIGVKNS